MEHDNTVLKNDIWERNGLPCEEESTVLRKVKKISYDRKNEVELVHCHNMHAPISKKLMLEGYMGYHLVERNDERNSR